MLQNFCRNVPDYLSFEKFYANIAYTPIVTFALSTLEYGPVNEPRPRQKFSRLDIVDEYFIAEFSNNICTLQDTVEIVKCPDPDVDVANGMTPSDLNGQNDVFWIKNIEFYPNNRLWIYNGWGNLIYKTEGYDNVENAWDGTRLGVDMPAAVYYYILDLGNDEDHIKGTITIVR